MRSSSCAAPWLAVVMLLAAPAGATDQDSKTFFAQGRRLREGGDCSAAIIAFRRALEISPEGIGALRNVAECEEQLGQFASARNDWWSLRRAALQSSDPNYQGWDRDAEVAYAKLADKVARLTIRLAGEGLDRVRVIVDGKPLDPRLLGVELERDLGLHTIEGAYGGAASVVEKRSLAAGANEVVTLVIPSSTPREKPGAAAPSGAASVAPPPADRRELRTAGFVAIGVGGLGVVGTVIAIAARGAALSTVRASCKDPEAPCVAPQSVADAYGRGKTFSTLANVFGGVGIAGVGAGVAMILLARPATSAAEAAAPKAARGVALDGGVSTLPGGGGVWAKVRF